MKPKPFSSLNHFTVPVCRLDIWCISRNNVFSSAVLPRTGCKPRRFASNPTSSGRDAVILARFACDAGKPRVRLRDAEAARIERPAEPVEQLAPGTRHPAGERTLQMRVAWRVGPIFSPGGAAGCDPRARGDWGGRV